MILSIKNITRGFVLLLVLFAVLVTILVVKHKETATVLLDCKTLHIESSCVKETIQEKIETNPQQAGQYLEDLARLRIFHAVFGDFRAYSVPLHYLGAQFYEEVVAFDELENFCPRAVKDGCVHGYVMQHIAENNLEAGKLLCESASTARLSAGCYHALGHSYAEFNTDSLFVGICPDSGLDQVACISGTMHEITKGGVGQGHDSHYARDVQSERLTCADVPEAWYTVCYGALGSFDQYHETSSSLRETYTLCEAAETNEARRLCKLMARERIMISRGYSFIPQ